MKRWGRSRRCTNWRVKFHEAEGDPDAVADERTASSGAESGLTDTTIQHQRHTTAVADSETDLESDVESHRQGIVGDTDTDAEGARPPPSPKTWRNRLNLSRSASRKRCLFKDERGLGGGQRRALFLGTGDKEVHSVTKTSVCERSAWTYKS